MSNRCGLARNPDQKVVFEFLSRAVDRATNNDLRQKRIMPRALRRFSTSRLKMKCRRQNAGYQSRTGAGLQQVVAEIPNAYGRYCSNPAAIRQGG